MSEPQTAAAAAEAPPSYLADGKTIRSWLLTTDHKRVAILYLFAVVAFFALGGFFAAMMRIELATPEGDLLSAETYNKFFTMHGVIMVWFFLIPVIPAVLGNFLLPMMLGAEDVAFPKLNLASWYFFVIGGAVTLISVLTGGVDTGWTFYAPFTASFSETSILPTLIGVTITGFSTILTGVNFIVTTHMLRPRAMGWFRLPLFVWSLYATSLIMVLATPVLAITLLLTLAEKTFEVGIFDPQFGGDPLLYQHLFWMYSHPAVYIMILPGMGVMSEIVTCFSRKRIFGYAFIAYSSLAIAVFGFLVWGHHMFVSGQSPYASMLFSVLSFLVAVPSAVKVFNWVATLHRGSIHLTTPMLYALGFLGLFTIGGLTGLYLASLAVDVQLHDTYFVVAHFHYIMVGGMVTSTLAGLHFWWPKITGRLYPEKAGVVAAIAIFVGFNLTFFPQFVAGALGMPRRYHSYPEEFGTLQLVSSLGAAVLAVGYLLPVGYLLWSLRWGRRAPADPWRASGLEWQSPSPPPTSNFVEPPVVDGPAYDYDPADAVGPLPVAEPAPA